MVQKNHLLLGFVLLLYYFGSIVCQSTEEPSFCPDALDLSPFCNCSYGSESSVVLDCSDVKDENELIQIFSTTFFPVVDVHELRIENNQDLTFISKNVFGEVTFEILTFNNDAISFIDETAFVNSNSTLLEWHMKNCQLLPQGFPFSSLHLYTALETLYMDSAGENFTVLPTIVSNSLQTLQMTRCGVQYLHVDAIKDLPNLAYLYMHSNSISTLSPGLFDNNQLLELVYLNDNIIGTLESGTFKNLTQLVTINLGTNRISTIHAGAFLNLHKLQRLYLRFNALPYFLSEELLSLPSLTNLYIDNNAITLVDSALLNGNPLTQYVYAGFNKISSLSAGTFDALENGDLFLNNNLLTTLDENWLGKVLTNHNNVFLSENPLECGCDLSWLFKDPTIMYNLRAECSNGTDIHDLDSSFFINNCSQE